MLSKLLFSSMITFFLIDMGINLEAQEKKISTNNSLINKFCISTLKSKLKFEDKKVLNEISHFTCKCFMERYRSGSSIKNSRDYCKDIATEKYNL